MSNYTKIQNWVSLTGTTINGTPFDTEFAAVATASATKSNKKIPVTANNLASLSSAGDLQDSGLLTLNVLDAVSFHYIVGDVKLSAIDSEPTGWLYCDGSSISTSTYSALFGAIGYTYGGSGASFNVPDLRGTVPAGMDNLGGTSANVITDANADSLAGTSGAEGMTISGATASHVLTIAEMPAHTHDTDFAPSYGADGSGGDLRVNPNTDRTTSSTGGDGGHTHDYGTLVGTTNVQPTLFMNYLIKT